MRKLRTILQCKILLSILICFTFIYVFFRVQNIPINSKMLLKNEIEGVVSYVDDNSMVVEDILIFNSQNIIIGDRVICSGKISLPSKNTNFYMFNYQNFLASKKIYYIMNGECRVVESSKSIIGKINKNIKEYFNSFESKNYLNAFILGDTNMIEDNVIESYRENGINHLFSISGMHIGFIIGILSFIKKKWIIIIILFAYLIVLGFPPSMTRAVVFFSLLTFNKKIGVSSKVLFLYLLIFMLISNPFYIYNIGFVYSYLISFFLIVYSDLFDSNKYLKRLMKTSFVIFMITAPINIQNNHYLNFLSPLLNVLFIPFVTFILFPMSFFVILFPFLDRGYYIICICFESLSLLLSKIDILLFSFKYMNLIPFILYYVIIIFLLNKMRYYDYKFIFIFVIVLMLHIIYPYIEQNSYITFLAVGQGDSTLIKTSKVSILIDTGGIYSTPLANNVIVPTLRSYGLNKLDYLVLSHGDYDHMGEAMNLVNNFKVKKVIFNCGEFNDLEKDLIKVLDKKKIPYYSCIKELNINNNKLYFLNNKDYGNENDNSSVIYTELNEHKFLFMGDASVEVEQDLIEKYNLQNIDVLKVGHHGSKTSSSKKFIDEIESKYSIISVGKNNRYGHPNREVLDNLSNSKIYRTDKDGSITVKIKKSKLKIEMCIS